ncbi:hypothetical protein EPN87_02500 [archaeon]|nr:MAG: hypothetical protein EPN87_02500 [archaeon]
MSSENQTKEPTLDEIAVTLVCLPKIIYGVVYDNLQGGDKTKEEIIDCIVKFYQDRVDDPQYRRIIRNFKHYHGTLKNIAEMDFKDIEISKLTKIGNRYRWGIKDDSLTMYM